MSLGEHTLQAFQDCFLDCDLPGDKHMYQFVKIFTHSLEFIHRHVLERFFDVVDPLVFHGISGSMDSVVGFCRMASRKEY